MKMKGSEFVATQPSRGVTAIAVSTSARRQRRHKLLQDSSRQLDVVLGKLQRTSSVNLVKSFGHEPSEVRVHGTAGGQCRVGTGRRTDRCVMSRWQRWHWPFRQTYTLTWRRLVACSVPATTQRHRCLEVLHRKSPPFLKIIFTQCCTSFCYINIPMMCIHCIFNEMFNVQQTWEWLYLVKPTWLGPKPTWSRLEVDFLLKMWLEMTLNK